MFAPIELVVARYNEKLDWINLEPFQSHRKLIYNKGPSMKPTDLPRRISKDELFELPNVGREGHTYLYHIIENYEKLSDVTIFLPGSCMNEHKSYHTIQLVNKVMETKETALFGKWYANVRSNLKSFSINTWKGTSAENNQLSPELTCQPSQIARPYGNWFDHFFPNIVIHVVSYTSMFAVSRAHIHQHPIDYYRHLLASLSSHANPEDGHFIERSWVAVFHPIPERCLFAARPVHAHTDGASSSGEKATVSGADKAIAKALNGKQSMSSLLGLYGNKSTGVSNDTSSDVAKSVVSQKIEEKLQISSTVRSSSRTSRSRRRSRSRSRIRSRSRDRQHHSRGDDKQFNASSSERSYSTHQNTTTSRSDSSWDNQRYSDDIDSYSGNDNTRGGKSQYTDFRGDSYSYKDRDSQSSYHHRGPTRDDDNRKNKNNNNSNRHGSSRSRDRDRDTHFYTKDNNSYNWNSSSTSSSYSSQGRYDRDRERNNR